MIFDEATQNEQSMITNYKNDKADWWNDTQFGDPAACETFLDFENKMSKIICPLLVCSKCHKETIISNGGTGKLLQLAQKVSPSTANHVLDHLDSMLL